MNKKLSIVAALSLSLLAFSSCKKDKKEEGKEADTTAKVTGEKGDKPTEVKPEANKPDAVKPAAEVKGVWKHIPASSEIVVSINVGKIMESSLWKAYGPMAMAKADDKLKLVKEKCGFDPLTAFSSIQMGMDSDNGKEPTIVIQGIERAAAQKCMIALAESEGEKVEITEDGPISIVKSDKETTGLAWVNDTTVILTPKQADKEYLLARIAGTDGVDSNAALMAIVGKAKQSAPFWFAASLKEGSKASKSAKGATQGKEPTAFYGAVGFDKGIELAVGATFKTAEEAASLKAEMEQLLPMGKGMLPAAGPIIDKVKIGNAGNDLTIALELTEADIETLKKAAGPMMGGM